MNKLVKTLEEAVRLSGLRDGMTVSFHHHLRNGDGVANLVCRTLAEMGFHDLTVNASSIHNVHGPIAEQIRAGVITGIVSPYIGGEVGRAVSRGELKHPAQFCTHGARPADIRAGKTPIDVAFITAPTADDCGNLSGKYGPSACGALGYVLDEARYARCVIAITDNLVPHPLADYSIPESDVDYVVRVDSIGDPAGIVSSTTRITRDPVALRIAEYAGRAIEASGLLTDGFAFQTGAGGAALATAAYLRDVMLEKKVRGSYCTGGMTQYLVQMQHEGCFESLMDVQCFDLQAVEDLRTNPNHREISAAQYAAPGTRGSLVDNLSAVVLGATEIDTQFNVNVQTDSSGVIMGGSGGHSDAAAGAKLTIIAAPLTRARLPVITDRVQCISTAGKDVDLLVTQYGLAVNPRRADLKEQLLAARLPVVDIGRLKEMALEMSGVPQLVRPQGCVVAVVNGRDGTVMDEIRGL